RTPRLAQAEDQLQHGLQVAVGQGSVSRRAGEVLAATGAERVVVRRDDPDLVWFVSIQFGRSEGSPREWDTKTVERDFPTGRCLVRIRSAAQRWIASDEVGCVRGGDAKAQRFR